MTRAAFTLLLKADISNRARPRRRDLPECADAVLHHRQALSFTRHPGLCVQEVDRNPCPPKGPVQAEAVRGGPVRPHGSSGAVARCAAESRDADLGRNSPLSRERTPQRGGGDYDERGGKAPHRSSRAQVHFTPRVSQPLVALFSPLTIQL